MLMADFDLATEPRSAFASFEEATHYLELACARMKVNHLSYWLVHSIDGTPDQVSWIATYDPAYMSYYMQNYTPLGDPTFESAISENSVADWSEWLPNDSMTQDLLPAAMKYGITKYGISFPPFFLAVLCVLAPLRETIIGRIVRLLMLIIRHAPT